MIIKKIIYAFQGNITHLLVKDNHLVSVGNEFNQRMGINVRIKIYSVDDKQLVHTLPLTKPVKCIKFFEIFDNNGRIEGIAIALQDEITLLIIKQVKFVLEYIKADLKYVQSQCQNRRKRSITSIDITRSGIMAAGLDTGDIAIWKINTLAGNCRVALVIINVFDRQID